MIIYSFCTQILSFLLWVPTGMKNPMEELNLWGQTWQSLIIISSCLSIPHRLTLISSLVFNSTSKFLFFNFSEGLIFAINLCFLFLICLAMLFLPHIRSVLYSLSTPRSFQASQFFKRKYWKLSKRLYDFVISVDFAWALI